MDSRETVSDLIAKRVRALREGRGMSVKALAARCAEEGMPRLTEQALYKLEGQRTSADRRPRPVSVDELLVLAFVLDVAPVHLIAGFDDTRLPVSPQWSISAEGARDWIRGLAPLSGTDRARYEANVPASERDTQWFTVRDVTSYEQLEMALEGIKAHISLLRWREENKGGS